MATTARAPMAFSALRVLALIPIVCCRADVAISVVPAYANTPLDSSFTTTFVVRAFADSVVGAFDADLVYDRVALQITHVAPDPTSGWQGAIQADAASFRSGKTRVTGLRPPETAATPVRDPVLVVTWKVIGVRATVARLTFEPRSLIDDKWKPIGFTSWPAVIAVADADADGNGLPDNWELAFFGRTTGASPTADPDGDGFTNLREYRAGTNPLDASSSPASFASRMQNFSVRSTAGSGDQSLIVGFAIGGEGSKQVLLRGVGPTLAQFGVVGSVSDPQLRVFRGSTLVGENDNWPGTTAVADASARVGAFALPAGSRDSAILSGLGPNSYTAQLVSGGAPGIALLEAYDADPAMSGSQFVNISARNQVGSGANVLIAGFVISGNSPKTLLLRAVGPTLSQFGVSGAMSDPTLGVFSGGRQLDSNDNWGGTATLASAFDRVGAFSLGNNSRDAALIITAQPGAYTAQVSGVGGATGVALVEIYELTP